MVTPFVLARETWKSTEADLEKFTTRSFKPRTPVELPEIDLGEDEFVGRRGIPISKIGEAGKVNEAIEVFSAWEKIEQMEDGPLKETMKKALETKAQRLTDSS